jgi:methyl-accepting chemotaxis protein
MEISKLIDATAEGVRKGASVSKEAQRIFEGILSSVHETQRSVNEIGQAAQAQRKQSESIGELVDSLNGNAA